MSLKGKNAVVTGGTGALGSAVAGRFLKEEINVVASVTNPQKSAAAHLRYVKANVTKEMEVHTLFEECQKAYGSVDIVVNTVGGYLPTKPLEHVSVEDWDRMMEINLKSTFLCTREALRIMKGAPYGRVINISAMVGLKPTPGRIPYAVSKAGVSLLTEVAAREVKDTGITVNAIAPGTLDTPANREWVSKEDTGKMVPLERVADIICFLCSDEAQYISGTTLRAFGAM